jgi:hypothetical protein
VRSHIKLKFVLLFYVDFIPLIDFIFVHFMFVILFLFYFYFFAWIRRDAETLQRPLLNIDIEKPSPLTLASGDRLGNIFIWSVLDASVMCSLQGNMKKNYELNV